MDIKQKVQTTKSFISRYGNIIFFVGGFLFDSLTIIRIDSLLDVAIQALYLGGITLIILFQSRHEAGQWTPTGRIAKVWHYETEVVHFFYGGLLSAYVILYFKSTSLSRSSVFLTLVGILMFANEMPQIRKAGNYLRLGLYALCVVSFLNYLVPVIIGKMGWWVFLIGWLISLLINYYVLMAVARLDPDPRTAVRRLGLSPFAVMAVIFILYFAKLIPPVPLSVQYVGVFHAVEKKADHYQLTYRKPHWYQPWRRDDSNYFARPDDRICVFVRVFAPTRFEHQVSIRYSRRDSKGKWISTDRIPLGVHGGRDEGYRGFAVKENFEPGEWRVDIETEDDRTLGVKRFTVIPDTAEEPPLYTTRVM